MTHRPIGSLLCLVVGFIGCLAGPQPERPLVHPSRASSIREVLQNECNLLFAECAAHPTSAIKIALVGKDVVVDLACAKVLEHVGTCSTLPYKGRLPDDMAEAGVDAADIHSALLFECSTIVGHCSEKGINVVRVSLLGSSKMHEDFRCEELVPELENGCKNVVVRAIAPPVTTPKDPPPAPPPTTLAPTPGGAWQLHPNDPQFPPGATSFPYWWDQDQLDQWKDAQATAWRDLGADCASACAAIHINCSGVETTCSKSIRSLGFMVNGKGTVITCARMKQWTCTEGTTFTGELCEASLCTEL